MNREIEVFLVHGDTGDRLDQLDGITYGEWVARDRDVGTWVLQLDRATGRKTFGDRVAIHAVIHDDLSPPEGSTLMTGPVLVRDWDRALTAEIERDHLVLGGTDDMVWLRRLAHPAPTEAYTPPSQQYTVARDNRSGVCSTVLAAYVDANLGPGALAPRRVPRQSIATDPLIGSTVFGSLRQAVLLDALREISSRAGVTFSNPDRTFTVATPGSVRIATSLGHVAAYRFLETAPYKALGNHLVVGIGGEGAARTFVEVQAGSSVARWGRFESFVDRRDLTDVAAAQAAGEDRLAAEGVSSEGAVELLRGVTITLVDDSPTMQWRRDWNLGDIATFVVDDVDDNPLLEVTTAITEANVTMTADHGVVVTPGLGVASTVPVDDPFARIRSQIDNEIRNLEAI